MLDFKNLLTEYDPKAPTATVDFETYYDDDCSVSDQSYYAYTSHPKFEAYLVAIVAGDPNNPDISWVGPPKDFDWHKLQEYPLWAAHNSPFDRAIHKKLVETGEIPSVYPSMTWVNTADLVAYHKLPRSLGNAVKHYYRTGLKKEVRADMKGRRYGDLDGEEKEKINEYGLKDSIYAHKLWVDLSPTWPRDEQLLSLHTNECVERGVQVDVEKAHHYYKVTKTALDSAEAKIPWAGEQDVTSKGRLRWRRNGEPILVSPTSPKKLSEYARNKEIPLPTTTEAKSEEFQEWEKEWGEKFPVVKAIQTWRKVNRLARLLEQVIQRLRPDGRMEFQLCYMGAAETGRWSGRPGGGSIRGDDDEKSLNMQNLLKGVFWFDEAYFVTEKEGKCEHEVNFRSLFIPEPNRKMGIVDWSQIEPRCLAVLAGDKDFVKRCAEGQSPYEVHARLTMGFQGENLKKEDPSSYAFAKARVLSLGYNAGWKKFISMAYMYVGDEIFRQIFIERQPTAEEEEKFFDYLEKYFETEAVMFPTMDRETKNTWINSWLQVQDYRRKNPKIAGKNGLWKTLEADFFTSARRKEDFTIELPSGRKLDYMEISKLNRTAVCSKGGRRKNIYGGILTENLVQAVARDIHGWGLLRLEAAGYHVIWHVHDEYIIDNLRGEKDLEEVRRILSEPPPWLKNLPVDVEGELSDYYKK